MKQSSVRLSVCPVDRHQQLPPAGLLLSALRAGDIDRWQAPAAVADVDRRDRQTDARLFHRPSSAYGWTASEIRLGTPETVAGTEKNFGAQTI